MAIDMFPTLTMFTSYLEVLPLETDFYEDLLGRGQETAR